MLSRFRLRSFLLIPFLLQISLAVGLTGYLSLKNGEQAVSDVAKQLGQEVTNRISERLNAYIAIPPLVNRMTANAIAAGYLNPRDHQSLGRHIWHQITTFEGISFRYFGSNEGEMVTARRLSSGVVMPGRSNASTNWQLTYFKADQNGDPTDLVESVPRPFNPRERPWYLAAAEARKAVWTPIYRHFVTKELSITATQPIYNRNGTLEGVLGADFVFSQVNRYLQSLKIGQTGLTFVIERSGDLVVTSTREPTFTIKDEKTYRIAAIESQNQLIKTATAYLNHKFPNFEVLPDQLQAEFVDAEGDRYFLQVAPLRDINGIDWLIVVVIPQSDFMEHIEANTQQTIWLCVLALVVAALGGLYAAEVLAAPITHLATIAAQLTNKLKTGQAATIHQPILVPERGTQELQVLARSFNAMSSELQDALQKLEERATRDALTGLPNRSSCLSHLQDFMDTQRPFGILFLDLDRFKLINDSLGHLAGDLLLVEVAKRLQACLQPHDILARFGGDEFIILLPDREDYEEVMSTADALQNALKEPFELNGYEVFTSISIGVVTSKTGETNANNLLRDADVALYEAKQAGKAQAKYFDTSLRSQVQERLQIENDLRRALAQQEFCIKYQPIVSASTRKVIGLEALVRWQHPTRGLLLPRDFLPIAEDTGWIVEIDLWVLQMACQQMQVWRSLFPESGLQYISTNISGKLFHSTERLKQIERVLLETNLPPQYLQLEIVEQTLVESTDSTIQFLQNLRNRGVRLSIDDFGTYYSSLAYLCRFPFNTLKIDRTFVEGLEKNKTNLEVARAIVFLARNLNAKVTAEGVCTETQLSLLLQLKCDELQGWLFSHALSSKEIDTMLEKSETGIRL